MRKSELVRKLTVIFLTLQGVGTFIWWAVLLTFPVAREPFMAPGAPDASLLAFFVPDLLIYAGGALVVAYGLMRQSAWAWPVLCINAGAAVYAALYALTLPLLSGGGWLGAVMMLPSLVVLPIAVWLLRPERML
ncbi:MAG: hypothetical protein ABIO92_06015 [Chloroflexia bacterium]